MKARFVILILLLVTLGAGNAFAQVYELDEWATNVNGTITDCIGCGSIPSGMTSTVVTQAGQPWVSTLGSTTFTITGTGSTYFSVLFNYGINPGLNGYFNEFGSANGTLPAGMSWEIDEPGWNCSGGRGVGPAIDPTGPCGTIFNDFSNSSLTDTTSLTASDPYEPALALSWDFTIPAGDEAEITTTLSDTAPASGFYLAQYDSADSSPGANDGTSDVLYLSAGPIEFIPTGVTPVPEPASFTILGSSLLALLGRRIWKK